MRPKVARTPPSDEQLELGRDLRDDGVRAANDGRDTWWSECCDRGIAELARRGQPFQAADLLELGVPEPDHPNRWGGRLYAAGRAGTIECVAFAQSKRPTTRASIVRVWRGAGS